jgi:cell division protein FtsI (penicillin-binding protein 3)
MTDPKYVMLIILDEPQATAKTAGFSTGGWTSAPVSGRIIKRMAPFLGVLPVDEKSPLVQSAMRIESHHQENGKGYATR